MKRLSMMVLTAGLLSSALLIASCAGSPFRIAMMDKAELRQVDDYTLCGAHGCKFVQRDRIAAEIRRRGLFTLEEWEMIKERKIRVGAKELLLFASWGLPTNSNRTLTAYGKNIQHIYRISEYTNNYVYVENGKITTIQN